MEPSITDELVDITGNIVDGVRDPASNWAALILVLAFLIVAVLVWRWMAYHNDRVTAREQTLRQDAIDAKDKAQREFDLQLAQYQRREDGYGVMLSSVNTALGGVVEAIRQNTAVLDGARRALDRSSDLVERLVPEPARPANKRMPKKSTSKVAPEERGE